MAKGKADEANIKATELADKGKVNILEPDIAALDANLNASMGVVMPTQEGDPVTSASEVSSQNNSGPSQPSNDVNTTGAGGDLLHKIPEEIEEPLEGKVIERDYTKIAGPPQQTITDPNTGNQVAAPEPILPEAIINPTVSLPPGQPPPPNTPGSGTAGASPGQPASGPAKNPSAQNLEDLSPSQKRKLAEKNADAILKTYQHVSPMLPKWMASFNIPRWQRAELRGEINLKLVVNDEGLRVIDYMETVNQNVDSIFVVKDEDLKDIRDPLIDVLLEKNVALTPTERLMIAVANHLGLMIFSAATIVKSNNAALKQFKVFHEENVKAGRAVTPANPTPTSEQPGNVKTTAKATEPQKTTTKPAETQPVTQKQAPIDSVKLEELLRPEPKEDILTEGNGFELHEFENEE